MRYKTGWKMGAVQRVCTETHWSLTALLSNDMSETSNTPSLYGSAYPGKDSLFKLTPLPPSPIDYEEGKDHTPTGSVTGQRLSAYDTSYIVSQPNHFQEDMPATFVDNHLSPKTSKQDAPTNQQSESVHPGAPWFS